MTGAGISAGSPETLGVTPDAGGGVNVAVFSAHASAIEFCLFDAAGGRELRRFKLPERTGDIFHGHLADIAVGARYGLRAHGVFAPEEGHRFNPCKLLVDPYARAIDRQFRLDPTMFGSKPGVAGPDERDSAPTMPKAIVTHPGAADISHSALIPWPDTILYELHVRGFTMRQEAIPAPLRGTFAGLVHPASIEQLVRLGVTSVEIMPAAAWIEERHLAALGLGNYWGYNPVAPMAPDPRLAPGGWEEIRAAVQALAEAGIETILDVVLNHTGEGDALGPTLSLRGLDNASYYRLIPESLDRYSDETGCGNALALDRPPVLRLAMDTLRIWAALGGVHGFRFDLATTLGRRADGFDAAAPLLSAIDQDPMLRGLKLIAEPWDVGPGGYRPGAFPTLWGEWNDRFRDDVRRFWRGDQTGLGEIATRFAGSSDLFAGKRRPSRSVNFVTAHDGFTLADLVAYEHKENSANGEENRDGTDANYSWNNGVEGPSGESPVRNARARDQRALLATLLLARGTPMLSMGAELGHSQGGNNNAYAQDNETAWIDWSRSDLSLCAWAARLIALRRELPVLREDRFLAGQLLESSLLPDVEWRRPDGRAMSDQDWNAPDAEALVVVLCGSGRTGERVALIFNRGRSPVDVTLPQPQEGRVWRLRANSASIDDRDRPLDGCAIAAIGRAVLLLDEVPGRRGGRSGGGTGGGNRALAALALAAGIAPDWWTVDGTHHVVGDDTRRALLAAMGLPVAAEREARETLEHVAERWSRRPLPLAAVGWDAEPAIVYVPLESGLCRRPLGLTVQLESGETMSVRLAAENGNITPANAIDGRPQQLWRVRLPPLPVGRHTIRRDDAPDVPCHLTVAPGRCYLPPPLATGKRLFGIAAQLYAIERPGDQGVGDFTSLGDLTEAAAAAGASILAINPLHALFPGQRDRASPYHPSDRRFLDPIYLDLSRLDGQTYSGCREQPIIDYPAVWALKREALERAFAEFEAISEARPDAEPVRAFAQFVVAGGEGLRRFAVFEAIAETRPGEPWPLWRNGLHDSGSSEVEAFARANLARIRFHQYLQFMCDRQLGQAAVRAASAGLGIGLLRDLAVGAAADGAEAWTQPAYFAGGVSVGAPPDPLAPDGQIWNLPPPIPHRMGETGFAGFSQILAANMRHAGGLRIDHVMGMSRLFWVPDGASGDDGAYVAYPFQDLLAQVSLESSRARCLTVGEDLGTVPEGLRTALSAADVFSYRVMLLEREGLGFSPSSAYPAKALACVTTHDLPTFGGWWEGRDIDERRSLDLISSDRHADALSRRGTEKQALQQALDGESIATPDEPRLSEPSRMAAAAYQYVARSPAALVLAQADDLAGSLVAVNLPGTDMERSNWRRKLPVGLPDLLCTPAAEAILNRLRAERSAVSASDPTPSETTTGPAARH